MDSVPEWSTQDWCAVALGEKERDISESDVCHITALHAQIL